MIIWWVLGGWFGGFVTGVVLMALLVSSRGDGEEV